VNDLTTQEQTRVRAALAFLHARAGTWGALAKALGFKETTLGHIAAGRKNATASLAFRVARFAGVGVDDVLTGRFPDPRCCPHCGHVREQEAAE